MLHGRLLAVSPAPHRVLAQPRDMTIATDPRQLNVDAQQASRPIRILIVEDGEPLRDLLGRALRLEGWTVCEVADGASALESARDFAPDAIVLDVMLPDLDGIRVVTELRASGDQTPVLFLTALDSTADRVEAYMAGGDDYMTKPFSLEGVAEH